MNALEIFGNIVDIPSRRIYNGNLIVANGRIESLIHSSDLVDESLPFILPGFIDSHVHIESSMLIPSEFARLAVVHGTVATISDPHEIANVCGISGVEFMIRNGASVNFKFYFGAPSCVPATTFETAGDVLDVTAVRNLLQRDEILYLSEMMNFPGVIYDDQEVMDKIAAAHEVSKPVDGHAPGLRGDLLKKYVSAGISTDHECFTLEEALEKLRLGMKVIIREGSAAKNFDALINILHDYPDMVMFCSDDKHPDSLVTGHINDLCKRAVETGIDLFNVLQAACLNPVKHYRLDVGTLHEGDPADFILVGDLKSFKVQSTYINGVCMAENGKTKLASVESGRINRFACNEITAGKIRCDASTSLIENKLPVIEALDAQLVTNKLFLEPKIIDGAIVSDVENDVLKIVVVNRYVECDPAMSFIKNFGIRQGAIASSVAHDSHNIIAVGADDKSIADAVNLVITNKGGVSCVNAETSYILALPVAGLMSTEDGYEIARQYITIDQMAKAMGSNLSAPFMTLSFMALLVIPSLKLSDKGLFDGDHFRFVV